ncbi:MAG: DMT family transporter [Gammaproteobacteria bacterium]|nr:DMT family transporter [Gammaproteobacteria bacterium]
MQHASEASGRSLTAAWLGVVLIWSTTPLAIQWSAVGAGWIFSIASRMAIGAAIFLAIFLLKRDKAFLKGEGRTAAIITALGIYTNMMLVYWAAQFVPSGLIAVIFGLSPIATALWSLAILHNERMTLPGVVGVGLGVFGLWLVFGGGDNLSSAGIPGIAAVTGAMAAQCLVAVLLKRLGTRQSSLTMTGGGVVYGSILFIASWWWMGAPLPQHEVETKAIAAIIYLGVAGSVVGFLMYFWLLRRVSPIRLSLVTLITPVTGLLLGQWLNNEVLPEQVWMGVLLILVGLGVYQFGDWKRLSDERRASA